MQKKWFSVFVFVGVILSLSFPAVHAQSNSNRPISRDDFAEGSVRGFGDRANSWAQSMVWWHDALYVGTTRQSLCTSLFASYQFVVLNFGAEFANTWFTYPPPDPDLDCAVNGADLPLQAEIWRWTPARNWERVFQSPLDLDNPGVPPLIPPPGKKLPYEIAIRGLVPHRDPDGTEALYAFGVNSTLIWDRDALPPPRILRTTDGTTWTPVPQDPGTFLGDLPFNPDHSSFRSPVSFNGRLFVLNGPIFGQGTLIASDNPAVGNDAWYLASPDGLAFYEMTSFNGWLYLGTFNPLGDGYSVVKTKAEGPPPYEMITVIPPGAFLPERGAKSVVSMREFQGRLYVGTATQTEIVRINPDDTWDLVVGTPRQAGSEWKYPLSGLDAGFGQTLNDHAWWMQEIYNKFYVGTYNASTATRFDPQASVLTHNMGAHLYRTDDGWHYGAITTNGFANLNDPFGGKFDYGIRTMAETPHGAFFGTANDQYGLMVFRAQSRGGKKDDGPALLEVEPLTSGSALLSWESNKGPFQVWRAEVNPILIRDDINFENWNGTFGNKIPDTYVTEYQPIGTTKDTFFVDDTVEPGKKYMYYVISTRKDGQSDQSNLVAFPLNTPAVTYEGLLQFVEKLRERGRFAGGLAGYDRVRAILEGSLSLAASCKISNASKALDAKKASREVLDPDALDIEVLFAKLERRLSLFPRFGPLMTTEFCQ